MLHRHSGCKQKIRAGQLLLMDHVTETDRRPWQTELDWGRGGTCMLHTDRFKVLSSFYWTKEPTENTVTSDRHCFQGCSLKPANVTLIDTHHLFTCCLTFTPGWQMPLAWRFYCKSQIERKKKIFISITGKQHRSKLLAVTKPTYVCVILLGTYCVCGIIS